LPHTGGWCDIYAYSKADIAQGERLQALCVVVSGSIRAGRILARAWCGVLEFEHSIARAFALLQDQREAGVIEKYRFAFYLVAVLFGFGSVFAAKAASDPDKFAAFFEIMLAFLTYFFAVTILVDLIMGIIGGLT
jgi:hypothetical protein